MSCIITYKGKKYSEEQFKEYFINNKQEFATSIAKNKDVIDSFKRKMEDIDYVFSQSPELASIGTKAQYLQYLSTIFKTSKVKDIVYHGSPKSKLEKVEGISFWTNEKGNAYAYNIERSNDNSEGFVTSAIVNIKNPYIHQEDVNSRFATTTPKDLIDSAKSKNADGAIWKDVEDIGGRETQIVVFEQEQIHILGSKQDIDGFKEFVNKTQPLYSVDKNAKIKLKHFTDYVGLNKKTLSPQQKINVAQRVEKYNKLNQTGHYVKFSRVGESMNYTWEVNQNWKDFDPTQGRLFNQLAPSKPSAERIEALDNKLKQILSNLGITVEDYNKHKESNGVDAIGVFKIVDGLVRIAVDEQKANETSLAEETSHFIVDMMSNRPLAERLLGLMRENDYYKTVLGTDLDAYIDAYNGNKEMLVKEAAGKLLAQAIVANFKQENLNIPEQHLNILQRLWNYVKNLFKSVDRKDLNKAIAETYGEVAEQFMKGDLEFMDAITLGSDITMYQISDSALNGLKAALNKARESSAKRLNVYKKKGIKSTAAIEETSLRKLEDLYEKQDYMSSALHVAEHARYMFTHVTTRTKELKKAIENLDVVGNDALLSLASTLRGMKSFADSYLPMLKEIQSEVADILEDEPDNVDYKKIDDIITDVVKKAEKLDKRYLEMARPLWAKYLTPFLYDGPITEENILQALKEGGKDITFVQRFIDSMAASGMPILQILDVAVKDAKQEARDESYNSIKELIQQRMDLEKSGIKDTKWMYEVKKDGSLSGNNVYKYNYGDWYDAKEAEGKRILDTIRKANKNIKLSDNDADLLDEIFANSELDLQYRKLWSSWYKNNSQANPYAREIIDAKKKQLIPEEFDEWYNENTSVSEYNGRVYYIRELSVPAKKYRNKQFDEIQSNPAKKKYYDHYMNLKEEQDSKLPQNQRLGRLAPQTRTDLVEKIKSSGSIREVGRNIKESFTEAFQNVEDETEINSRFKVTDENGKPVYFLPIHYTTKIKDTRNLSTDSTESLAAFISTTNDYYKMSKIIDILELGRDVISNIQLQEFDANGNVIKESIDVLGKKIAKAIKVDPKTSNMRARLDDYFKMNIYGMTRSEGTDYNIFGFKVNSEKMWDFLAKYTSVTNLAFNIYSGIQNPLIGNANIRIEAISGQFFGQKALAIADKKYWSNLAQNVANLGSRNAKDFISLWGEKMEVFQDYSREMKELNMDRHTLAQKLISNDAMYFNQNSGEHQLQFRTSFALAYETKLKDKDDKDITLLDAFDTVGNKLVLKSGLKKQDGSAFTEMDLRAWKRKQNSINNSMHGIYNDQDLLAIQQYGIMRNVLMFRKFVRPGYNRRFRKQMYDYERQSFVEGYYRTLSRFAGNLVKDLKRGQFLLTAHWAELTQQEKQNIMRGLADVGYIMAAAIFVNAILPMIGGDDDDDDWAIQMAAYQANRMLAELSFFIDPRQTIAILKSPAAGIESVNGAINLITKAANPWYGYEEISRGRWRGYTRVEKAAYEAVPVLKTVSDWAWPSDKLIYLKLNNR